MRPVRVAAVALIATAGLLLAGCSSDEPAASASSTASESPSPSSDPSGESGAVDDFPEVDGYTLVDLPDAARQAFATATQSAPQLEDFDGRLVEKDGQQVGMVMRVGLDVGQSELGDFEKQFLPGFASGIAGADVKPDFEEINGVKVVKIETPGGSGTAYAWIQSSVATILVFNSAEDAAAYADGATS